MKSKNSRQINKFGSHESSRSLLIEQMEDRVLFDAVPIAPVDAPVDANLLVQLDSISQALTADASIGHQQQQQQQQQEQPKEIVFVDKSVEGFEDIVAEFIAQRDVEVFFINDGSAGLVQIANHLQGRNDLNAIHIVSHGNDAQLNLGDSVIGTASLSSQYLNELVRIGQSLNENGDILIYGCDLASSVSGEAFIKEFSQLTNADVAASDDITGAVADGGDWVLEKQIGSIEAETLSSSSFKGSLIVTDAGFTIGTAPTLGSGEIAVVPVGESGTNSLLFSNAATAGGGTISIDVRLTLVNTFDELGNLTNGTVDQMPVTFGTWNASPILLSRVVGASVSGYEGHTAEILVEFFDNASGNPLSVVGDFTFHDIDFNVPGPGGGSEAIRVNSDEMASYTLSATPATEIDVIDNGDGTTTFTNDSSAGGANDQERWASIEFHDAPSLTLFFDARNSHTGYGLSTKNFSVTPNTFTQPDATPDDFTTDQDTSIAGNVVTANNGNGIDSDPDGDPLSVALVNGASANVGSSITGSNGGQFVIASNGSFNFNPSGDFDYLAAGESTTTTVTYQITDGTGLADTATVTVTVTGTNDSPSPVGSIPNQSNNDGDSITPIDVSGNFSDTDSTDTFTFSDGGTLPPGLSINPITGVISGTIDNSASVTGPFAVVITANDGNGGTTTQSFIWNVANPAPTATNNSGNVKEDTNLSDSGNVISDDDGSGVDFDPDNDALFVSAVNGAAGNVGVGLSGAYGSILINATGAYVYTLNNSHPAVSALDNGETLTDSFTYAVSDGEGGSSTATITITIAGTNDAPVVGSTLPNQTDQDAVTITPFSATSAFSDPDGDTLTYTASNLPTGLTIDSSGLITGTLTNDASQNAPGGVFTVTVTATDDNGASVSTTFDWTITNPGPNAVNDANATDQATTAFGNVLSNDSDPDGDSILVNAVAGSVANVGNVVGGSNGGQFTISSNGSYTFDPNGDFDSLADGETATTSVTYTITDNQGGTDTATLTLTITGTNDDPTVVASIPDQASLDAQTIATLDVSSFFSDTDSSDTLTFTAAGLPTGLSINAAGQITGTVDNSASQSGPFNVTVTANDGNGGTISQSFNWIITNPVPTATDNSGSVTEDGTLSDSGNVITDDDGLGTDSDPDGDSLAVSAVNGSGANVNVSTAGTYGSIVINSDGSYTYTLDNNNATVNALDNLETLTESFSYTISDGQGGTSTANITITINGTNDDPEVIGSMPNQAGLDGETVATFDVSSFFSDPDGDPLTFSAVGLPPGLTMAANGEITGTLDGSASQAAPGGIFTVTVTATDDNGDTVTDTFTWTVSNPAPVAQDNTASVTEDTDLTDSGNVITDNDGSGVDSDPDSDTLQVSAVAGSAANVGVSVTGTYGQLVINSNGDYTYTLDNTNPVVSALDIGDSLTESFAYTISDGEGGSSSATLLITINGSNDAPVVGATIPNQFDVDGQAISTLDASVHFSDPDGDTLTYSASGLPVGISIDSLTGEITGTPDSSASQGGTGGVYNVSITATDDNGQSVTTTFDWTVTNPAPVANDDAFSTDEDNAFSGSVAGNDSDADDTFTFNQLTSPNDGSLSFNPDGSFNYDPDPDFSGTDSFVYQIVDADGATATATVTITVDPVNDLPVVSTPVPDQASLDSDTVSLDVSPNFSDVEGNGLTFSATGLPIGLSMNAAGNITGTIDSSASASGPYTVVVTVVDGNGGSVTDTFTWTVTNPVPTATDDSFTTDEDTPVSGTVASNDTDSDGDSLTFAQSSAPANGSVVMAANGTFTYTPDAEFYGTDSFDYQVTDADGAAVTATVTITVNPVNDLPVVDTNIPDQASLDSDTVSLDVSSNFSDVEGNGLTFSATGLPIGLSMNAAGNITGTIDSSASASGPYTVVVTVVDGNGGSVTDTFTWNVTNPAPVATDDSYVTSEGVAITDTVASNDNDSDGDSLTYTPVSGPTNGTVAFAIDGSFTYTPNALFNGTDSFVYLVTDADGLTSTATVTITIFAVNDLPVVDTNIADQANVDSESISLDVSGNFSDPDGDILTFAATGLPTGLSIDTAGNITGTIDSSASASGPFTAVITANDGKGGTVTDTFTWTVTNPVPVANDDTFTTDEDTPVSGSVTGNDSDPDGDLVSFIQLTSPGNGTVTFNPSGNFTYTPDADFAGTDSFDYAIVDADGAITTATVNLTVDPVNDPPVVDSPIADQVNFDSDSISIDISSNFADVEGDGLTFTATGLPTGLSIDAAGNITGTIDSGASASGPFVVVVTVIDGNGGTVTDTFTWFVNNPAPVATDNTAVVTEDAAPVAAGNVITGDSGFGVDTDPDGDTLFTSAIDGNPANVGVTIGGAFGTIQINADGSYVYTVDDTNPTVDALDNTETLTESFSYEISDGNGGTSSALLTITINGRNDAPIVGGTIADQFNLDADSIAALDVSSAFSDVDGDPLTYVVSGLPAGLTIDFTTGLISGVIDGSASVGGPSGDGIYSVDVTATDDNGQSVSTTFTWTVDNPVPVAGDDSFTTNEDTPFTSSVTANDSDPDNDIVSYSVTSAPTNGILTFAIDGSFTYSPDADFFGTDTFDYQLCDADGDCTTATVTIGVVSVNDDPTLDSSIPDQSDNDSDLINLDISIHFGDPEGGPLTFTATGLPTGLSIDLTGNITGTIDSSASASGPYSVVVTAEDSSGATVTGTFTWNVSNPAPNATHDSFSTDEDTLLSATVATNDSDPDGDALTFNLLSGTTNGTLTFNPDGTFDYSPNSGFNGFDSFDYEVVDADGTASSATAVINVGAVNDIPVITVPIPDQTSLDSDVVNQDISGTFSDPDGDAMTFTATGLPPGLSLDPFTGEVVGTIDSSASVVGTYTIVVTANDGNGGTISETFIWTVDNPVPIAGDDNFSTDEEVAVAGTVVGNDNDPDGDTVTYNLTNGPTNGVVSLATDGSFTYTPNPDFFGTDSFDYEICDVDGACTVATVTIIVAPVNDAPATVTPIPDQANLDSELATLDISGFFSDVDGDVLTFSANNLPTGLAISPGGLISGTIDSSASQSGPFTVEIIADDGNGATFGQFFTWNVTNPAPTAGDDSFTTAEDTAVSGTVSLNDSDPDSDDTTFTVTANPSDGIVSFNTDGTFTYTPNADFFGVDTFEYEICDVDGACTSAIVTITVNSVNDSPAVATPIADQSSFDSDVIILDLSSLFTDPENDSLTFTEIGLPPGLTLDPITGIISGTIDSSASTTGPYTVVITVADGSGGTVTDTFTWTVANPIPIAQDDTFATAEDVPVSGTVATNDSDVDDSVTFSLATLPSNGVVVFNSDGSFTYTPDTNYIGFDSFEYELCDADGACVRATATIAIGPVNDPPVVVSPMADQVNFDSDSVTLDVGSAFTDPDGDILTFSATGLPPGLTMNPGSGVISGVIDSSASVIGTYVVVVTAGDANGGTTTDTFNWTVSNPLPVAQNDNYTTAEDLPLAASIAGNDVDPDGDILSFNLTSGPSNGTLTFNSDGTFNYTPDADFFGTDSFTYRVTDADGATSTAVATIGITPVNDGPTAVPDTTTTSEDTPVNVAVLSNDSDPENDPLTVTISTAPTNGSVTVNPDGSIDYTPDIDFNGTDSFDYEICDAGGLCSTATVTVNVTPVNDAPVANDDSFTTAEDTSIVGALVTNDSDPDGDPLTYSLVTPPAQGTLTLNPGGTFVYSPTPDFNGTVTFVYLVTDPSGATDTAVATINVAPDNDPPVAIDDVDNTSEDTVVTINLLGNDFDPESDTLSVTHINGIPVSPGNLVGLPSGATVTLNADGTVEYDPNGSFDGLDNGSSAIDSFLYTVSDGNGGYATAETVVTINGENDPPVAEDDYVRVTVDTSVTFNVLANDSDPEGDPLAVVLLNNPAGGTASVNPDGTISFVPDTGFVGIVHVHYLVEDPSGATSDATLTIEVEPEFRFDSFTNFSVTHLGRDNAGQDGLPTDRMLTEQIFTLSPEPIFSGFARPGTQVVGRVYDASGTLIGEGSANTDPGGNWLIQFPGTRGFQFYRVEFEQVAAVGTADIYGYIGLNPSDNSYQAMEAPTSYEKPLSVEVALFNSFRDLQQSHIQANNPLGFGRPEATQ